MRGAFGLISLLIGVAIVVYLWANQTKTVVESGGAARDQAQQISGHSADGTPVGQSLATEPENDPRGAFKDLLVTDVTPGAGMDAFYGLKKGDRIISVESLTTVELNSGPAMKDMLLDAFGKKQPIVVNRNGQQITLPLPPGSADPTPPATAPAAAPQSASPTGDQKQPPAAPVTPPTNNSIQDQVNRILKSAPEQ